jgi:uncharacterized protein (DUF1697 family)
MSLVVFLRGVNVGGYKTFKPTALAQQLQHLGVVSIGAAGTFVVRRAISRSQLRLELARRLPFETTILICSGIDIVRLASTTAFEDFPARTDTVRFVSVLSRLPRVGPRLPMTLPPAGKWLLNILARDGRFVLGLYRRQMKAIGYLSSLDRLFGVPVTTRNWNTMTTIARVLVEGAEK